MPQHVQPVAEDWDAGPRVAIFGAVDSGRWVTLQTLIRRALQIGHAVVIADQGLDPLIGHLEILAQELGIALQRWPVQPDGGARGWRGRLRARRGRAPTEGLPAFEQLLWIDLLASGLDVAGFVEGVHGVRLARGDQPVVVLGHDLTQRHDAAALLKLWDAAAAGDGRLCAILTAPGLPNEPRLRSALLEASVVGVHRLDSPTDAAILVDYLSQPLEAGVEAHEITVHDRTNLLPIAEFFVDLEDQKLPIVLVDATGRPDFVDLFRVADQEQDMPEVHVGWLVAPLSFQPRWIRMTCQVVRPVKAAYTIDFQAPEHTTLLRRIAAAGRFVLGVQPAEHTEALDGWIADGRLPSTVQAALERW
ncbi:MAG: hypothetical protein JO352_27330 [Chloroflexi bacterium]|nr:hypothetical protein [Chloroflexota bacterium]MBV9602088.1 hypothetical protein [Chloroflexota bacterium]